MYKVWCLFPPILCQLGSRSDCCLTSDHLVWKVCVCQAHQSLAIWCEHSVEKVVTLFIIWTVLWDSFRPQGLQFSGYAIPLVPGLATLLNSSAASYVQGHCHSGHHWETAISTFYCGCHPWSCNSAWGIAVNADGCLAAFTVWPANHSMLRLQQLPLYSTVAVHRSLCCRYLAL